MVKIVREILFHVGQFAAVAVAQKTGRTDSRDVSQMRLLHNAPTIGFVSTESKSDGCVSRVYSDHWLTNIILL